MARLSLIVLFAPCLLLLSNVLADDAAKSKNAKEKLSEAEIQKLIDQLGSDRFIVRRLAEAKLSRVGRAALVPLAKAAESDVAETRFRAMDIFKRMLKSDDDETREATKKALEKLRESKVAATARSAKSLLEQPMYELPAGLWRGEGGAAPGIRPGNIVFGNAPSGIKITGAGIVLGKTAQVAVTRIEDGQRVVDAIQGSGFGILILDGAKRPGIEIHVREPGEKGKPKFKRYLAKDQEELTENHPKIAELYQKYSRYQKSGTVMGGAPQ